MDCYICNSTITNQPFIATEMMFGTGKTYQYCQCNHCGCVQLQYPETDPANLYPGNYYSFNTYNISVIIKKIKQFTLRRAVAAALGYPSPFTSVFALNNRDGGAHALKGKINFESRILDVGCGDGSLISALSWCGFKNLTGIDPFLQADYVTPHYQLYKKSIEEFEGYSLFDVIMMHHSFEHVHQPALVMQHIKRLLTKDGRCIIRIPVSDSYAFEHYKSNWVQLDAPRHTFLHTNRSMEILAAANGLRIESIVDDSIDFQFIGSEQYMKGIGLSHPSSYYVSPQKKLFFNRKHPFSAGDIKQFRKRAVALNAEGRGDQRIYYLCNR